MTADLLLGIDLVDVQVEVSCDLDVRGLDDRAVRAGFEKLATSMCSSARGHRRLCTTARVGQSHGTLLRQPRHAAGRDNRSQHGRRRLSREGHVSPGEGGRRTDAFIDIEVIEGLFNFEEMRPLVEKESEAVDRRDARRTRFGALRSDSWASLANARIDPCSGWRRYPRPSESLSTRGSDTMQLVSATAGSRATLARSVTISRSV